MTLVLIGTFDQTDRLRWPLLLLADGFELKIAKVESVKQCCVFGANNEGDFNGVDTLTGEGAFGV